MGKLANQIFSLSFLEKWGYLFWADFGGYFCNICDKYREDIMIGNIAPIKHFTRYHQEEMAMAMLVSSK